MVVIDDVVGDAVDNVLCDVLDAVKDVDIVLGAVVVVLGVGVVVEGNSSDTGIYNATSGIGLVHGNVVVSLLLPSNGF